MSEEKQMDKRRVTCRKCGKKRYRKNCFIVAGGYLQKRKIWECRYGAGCRGFGKSLEL